MYNLAIQLNQLDQSAEALTVVDRAYEALRLSGAAPELPASCWQLHCPNKALGHTGVRAAYLIAPDAGPLTQRLEQLAASWVLSAEGQVLLMQLHRRLDRLLCRLLVCESHQIRHFLVPGFGRIGCEIRHRLFRRRDHRRRSRRW